MQLDTQWCFLHQLNNYDDIVIQIYFINFLNRPCIPSLKCTLRRQQYNTNIISQANWLNSDDLRLWCETQNEKQPADQPSLWWVVVVVEAKIHSQLQLPKSIATSLLINPVYKLHIFLCAELCDIASVCWACSSPRQKLVCSSFQCSSRSRTVIFLIQAIPANIWHHSRRFDWRTQRDGVQHTAMPWQCASDPTTVAVVVVAARLRT